MKSFCTEWVWHNGHTLLSNLAKMPDSAILAPVVLEGKSESDGEGHLLKGVAFKDRRWADVEEIVRHAIQLKKVIFRVESVVPASDHEYE